MLDILTKLRLFFICHKLIFCCEIIICKLSNNVQKEFKEDKDGQGLYSLPFKKLDISRLHSKQAALVCVPQSPPPSLSMQM